MDSGYFLFVPFYFFIFFIFALSQNIFQSEQSDCIVLLSTFTRISVLSANAIFYNCLHVDRYMYSCVFNIMCICIWISTLLSLDNLTVSMAQYIVQTGVCMYGIYVCLSVYLSISWHIKCLICSVTMTIKIM